MTLTFLYLPGFVREWNRHRLTDLDLQALEAAIDGAPDAPMIRGSGGLRKMRFAPPSMHAGKRGAMRVGFAWFRAKSAIVVVAMFAKNEASNFSKAELAAIVGELKRLEEFQMKARTTKRKRATIAAEIVADLKALNADLRAGVNVREKYTFRTARRVPEPGTYDAAGVQRTRELVGVSQPVFAQLIGVSVALVRAWESGHRTPAPIARRLLDLIRANPANWRAMIRAA